MHKEWHKVQKARSKSLADGNKLAPSEASRYKDALVCQDRAEDVVSWLCACGRKLQLEGKVTAAVKQYQKAMRHGPSEAEPFHRLGEIYHSTGEFKHAFECYVSALERCYMQHPLRGCSALNALDSLQKVDVGCDHDGQDIFCDCCPCEARPEKPAWMASASVLLKLAEELTEKRPDCQSGWAMLGCVQSNYFNNPSMAAKAFVKAAVAAGQKGEDDQVALFRERARKYLMRLGHRVY